jgi:ATP-dependent Lon protease
MVNIPTVFKDDPAGDGLQLPLLPLRDIVVFPHMVAPLFVGRTKSVNALANAMGRDKRVFLSTQKHAGVDSPEEADINRVGTIGKVLQLLKLPDGTVKALLEGESRARILKFLEMEDYFNVELAPMFEPEVDPIEAKALCRSVMENFGRYAKLNKSISKELMESVSEISSPSKLADTVAAHFAFKVEDKQRLLDKVAPAERVSDLVSLIKMEIEVLQMDQRIKGRVKEQMEKTQRNYYLNEQMRAIKKEMGAEDDPSEELEDLEKRIKAKKCPKRAPRRSSRNFAN